MNAPLQAIAPLSTDDERQAIQRAKAGDQAAMETLIRSQIRTMTTMAWRLARANRSDAEDLIQAGIVALVEALEDFDCTMSDRLWRFAELRVRKAMTETMLGHVASVTVPSRTAQRMWASERKTTTDEAAFSLATSPDNPRRMDAYTYAAAYAVLNASSLQYEGDGSSHDGDGYDQRRRADAVTPEEFTDTVESSLVIEQALRVLSDQERQVVVLHYGLSGLEPMIDSVIGGRLNLSRPRVANIRRAAEKKMACAMRGEE